MALAGPSPVSFNPVRRLSADLAAERHLEVPFPPGETWFSLRRTRGFASDPLSLLLDACDRFGPVFTMRVFHGNSVFMIGPNHYMTVSHAGNFSWREGHMGDLIPLLGDGLLTIDGDFHRRSRRIMLPAFHHKAIATSPASSGPSDSHLRARRRCPKGRTRRSEADPGSASGCASATSR
jgi:retinoid hydroxylase